LESQSVEFDYKTLYLYPWPVVYEIKNVIPVKTLQQFNSFHKKVKTFL